MFAADNLQVMLGSWRIIKNHKQCKINISDANVCFNKMINVNDDYANYRHKLVFEKLKQFMYVMIFDM